MKKEILITGGLGYLGGRIALALAANPGYALKLGTHKTSEKQYPDWVNGNNLNIVQMDLLSQDSLDKVCQGIDTIIHLAALNENDSLANPQQAFLVNSLGTLKLIESAKRAGVKKFIYFSTAHVYGSPLQGVITEKTLAFPVHPYAITHKAAEDFVIAADIKKEFSSVVIRLSNGFGAPADHYVNRWTLLVNDLCRQAVTQKKLVLKSSGIQSRDFISLKDVGRAVNHFLLLQDKNSDNCIYNLGGESPKTIYDMAQMIAVRCEKILGFKPVIIRPEVQHGEAPMEIKYCIDKLKSTGYSLISNFEEEIDLTIKLCEKYFRNGT